MKQKNPVKKREAVPHVIPLTANLSPSQKRWGYFVQTYNRGAAKHGLPRITTLGVIMEGGIPTLAEEEVLRMQRDYYAGLINNIDDLARIGFDFCNRQRQTAEMGRAKSPITTLIDLLATNYEYLGYTAKQLWPELLGSDGTDGFCLTESPGRDSEVYLEWSHDESHTAGTLKFASFEKKVSAARKALKASSSRINKKNSRKLANTK